MTVQQVRELAAGATLILALAELTDRQRVAVICHQMHGWSYREIGERLGLTKQAVQAHETAGLKKLQKLLEPSRPLLDD